MIYDAAYARAEKAYLEPPEDTRKVCYICEICGEPIRDGDEYSEIFGKPVCEDCIKDSKRYAEYDNLF